MVFNARGDVGIRITLGGSTAGFLSGLESLGFRLTAEASGNGDTDNAMFRDRICRFECTLPTRMAF